MNALDIINKHSLEVGQISRISGVKQKTVVRYIKGQGIRLQEVTDIEQAISDWKKVLYEKRKNLLANTSYGYLYHDNE